MKQQWTLAFTSVGRRVELVELLRNSLQKQGFEGKIIGLDARPFMAPAAYMCDDVFTLPKVSEPDYLPELLEVCKVAKVDLLIPLYEPEFSLLAQQQEAFLEIGTTIILSPLSALEICQDKLKTSQFLTELGLRTPPSLTLLHAELTEAKATVQAWFKQGECIVKPRSGMGSAGIRNIAGLTELEEYLQELKQQQGNLEAWILQPCLKGTEYTIDAFADWDGNLISAVPRIRLEVRSGEVVKSKTVAWPAWLEELPQITRTLKLAGPLTLQGFEHEGQFTWLEINPRFGGGVPLSMAAGIDYGKLLVQLAGGQSLEPQIKQYEAGLIMLRYDQSLFVKEPLTE